MLKQSASVVLASLRGSTYGTEYAFASSLVAALLDGLFEHPARREGDGERLLVEPRGVSLRHFQGTARPLPL